MIGEDYDEPAERRFPDVTKLCQEHPLAYAGFRISHLRRHDRQISETGEVPFLTSVVFPFVLLGYLVLLRPIALVNTVRRQTPVPDIGTDGHVFSMTSTHGYRTHTFTEIADEFKTRGEEAVFLCSPVATTERDTWEDRGFRTVSHRELHPYIGTFTALRGLVYALSLTVRLSRLAKVDMEPRNVILYYNVILLEFVKRESVRPLTESDPNVHTFSPMPYLIETSPSDRLFVYEHGIQPPTGGLIMAAPFFTPLTYFLWGEPCRPHFEAAVHSESELCVVGSPWYEYLSKKRTEEDSQHDVLLVSETHRLVDEEVEATFRAMVGTVIDTCESHGYSLVIKLHPLEDADWYEQHGWDGYVTEYEDIDEALLDVRVSVMDESSAFVESAVLATPAIVSDLKGLSLDSLAPVDYVTFTSGPEVGDAIVSVMNGETFRAANSRQLVRTKNTTHRIVERVGERRATG